MIVDSHIHIHGPYLSAGRLLADMDSLGVSKAVVLASPSKGVKGLRVPFWYSRTINRTAIGQALVRWASRSQSFKELPAPNNDDVIKVVNQARDRFYMLHFSSPHDDYSPEPLLTSIELHNCIGIKLHLWVHPVSLLDERLSALLEVANRFGLVVLIDLGGSPRALDEMWEVAARWPRASFIIPHLPPPLNRILRLAAARPNVFLDTSGPQVTTRLIAQAVKAAGADHVVFGSDSPRELGGTIEYALRTVYSARLSPASEELVLSDNIRSLINKANSHIRET
jgi:predicted TIM-barrel fold metal-dependent hydrolase